MPTSHFAVNSVQSVKKWVLVVYPSLPNLEARKKIRRAFRSEMCSFNAFVLRPAAYFETLGRHHRI